VKKMHAFMLLMAVCMVVMVALLPLFALAQETASAAAEPTWLIVLKAVVTIAASQVGPLITKAMSFILPSIPGWLRPFISVVVGAAASAFAGVETGGLDPTVAAGTGATLGGTTHAFMQSRPVPKPEPATS
jgi:hypothetical protein